MVYFNSKMIEKKAVAADLKAASIDNDDIVYGSDYCRLKGLQKSIFIMKCFERGFSKRAILEMAEACDGDKIGALSWIQFLKDIKWLQEKKGEEGVIKFLVTKEGKKGILTYEERSDGCKRQAG